MAQYIDSPHGVNNYFNIFTINFTWPRYKERARAYTTADKPCQPLGYKYIPCVVFACVLQVWACGCHMYPLAYSRPYCTDVSVTIPEHPVTLRFDHGPRVCLGCPRDPCGPCGHQWAWHLCSCV